jgi:regulator of RNase E activity RraA
VDLVGGRDGVLVIPRHMAEIAEQGYEQEQLEAYVSTKIHAGEPLRATTRRVTR